MTFADVVRALDSEPDVLVGKGFHNDVLKREGKIFAMDYAGAMVFTFLASGVSQSRAVLLPYFVMAPAVHLAHRDYVGAIESLILHVGLPIAGWYIGRAIDPPDCTPTPEKWCLPHCPTARTWALPPCSCAVNCW